MATLVNTYVRRAHYQDGPKKDGSKWARHSYLFDGADVYFSKFVEPGSQPLPEGTELEWVNYEPQDNPKFGNLITEMKVREFQLTNRSMKVREPSQTSGTTDYQKRKELSVCMSYVKDLLCAMVTTHLKDFEYRVDSFDVLVAQLIDETKKLYVAFTDMAEGKDEEELTNPFDEPPI